MRMLVLILVVVGCAKPAGGPLAHTFDNTKIATVPLDQKQAVTLAQQQHELAVLNHKNATGRYRESEIEQDLAEHQADRTIVVSLVVASKQSGAKLAPASAETASLARKTADAKVAFMDARASWLGKASEVSLFAVYATQARLELERAKVAHANRLVAPDFNVDAFQKQADAREQAAKVVAEATENERKNAEAKLAAWAELEGAYLTANGVKGPLESGRYAAEWKPSPTLPAEPTPTATTATPTTP